MSVKLRCAASKYAQSDHLCSFCGRFGTDNSIWDFYLKIMTIQEVRSNESAAIYCIWLE
jgi:hypothetical protein